MFASSWSLAVSNPGFIFGFEPNTGLTESEKIGFIILDLIFFLLHPIILKLRSSSLCQQQEAIKESLDLRLSEQYEKNLAKITQLNNYYYSYKRLELNWETILQITLSVVLFLYGKSNTTTSNSLKALFKHEITIPDKFSKIARFNTYWLDINTILDRIDPTYAIVFNFALSVLSFTRYVLLTLSYCKTSKLFINLQKGGIQQLRGPILTQF